MTALVLTAPHSDFIRNEATPEGREMGRIMAHWCDDAEPKARLVEPSLPPRCSSCAFRDGNHVANGSPQAQLDALKCLLEHSPFYCHDVHRADHVCAGWMMMHLAHKDDAPIEAPWDFVGGVDKASKP